MTEARVLHYQATLRQQDKVAAYLDTFSRRQIQITYECHVWEVSLDDTEEVGVGLRELLANFGDLAISASGGPSQAVADGLSLDAILSGDRISVSGLLNLLKRQRTVRTLSQPMISLVSGSKASFTAGETIRYVSEIGQVIPGNSNLSTLPTSRSKELDLGLEFNVAGEYFDGIVYSDIGITLSSLQGFQEFPAGENQILRLPNTTQREIRQQVRIRPGDILLLAGLQQLTDDNEGTGPFAVGRTMPLTTSREKNYSQSELLIVMVPRIVAYDPDFREPANRPAFVEPGAAGAYRSEDTYYRLPDGRIYDLLEGKLLEPLKLAPSAGGGTDSSSVPEAVSPGAASPGAIPPLEYLPPGNSAGPPGNSADKVADRSQQRPDRTAGTIQSPAPRQPHPNPHHMQADRGSAGDGLDRGAVQPQKQPVLQETEQRGQASVESRNMAGKKAGTLITGVTQLREPDLYALLAMPETEIDGRLAGTLEGKTPVLISENMPARLLPDQKGSAALTPAKLTPATLTPAAVAPATGAPATGTQKGHIRDGLDSPDSGARIGRFLEALIRDVGKGLAGFIREVTGLATSQEEPGAPQIPDLKREQASTSPGTGNGGLIWS